jgi:hypothetical protein
VLRPLAWFRSKGARVAWLAFFALACQLEFTFGHVHLGNGGAISAALSASADTNTPSPATQSAPAQKPPGGLARDFCAVCNSISLASTVILPVPLVAATPASLPYRPRWRLQAGEPVSRNPAYFNARGPPDA